MMINWSKVSELGLEAILQGIIAAVTVIISYKLGKKQEREKWQREENQRNEAILEKKRKEQLEKKFSLLWAIFDDFDEIRIFAANPINISTAVEQGRKQIQWQIQKTRFYFRGNDPMDTTVDTFLNQVIELTAAISEPTDQQTMTRNVGVSMIFEQLVEVIKYLEDSLSK
jgi:hypothetical protein